MGLLGGCCLSLLAIVAPPIPVLFRTGCGSSLFINCILTVLGWIPGVFHAWYIILRYPDGKHRRKRVREVRVVERRSSHSSYGGDGRHHSHHHHHHGGHGHHAAPPRAGYGPPPAAQGLYYPPQEQGYVRRSSRY